MTVQSTPSQSSPVRDPWTTTGLTAGALAAGLMSFSAWTVLGQLVGINQSTAIGGLVLRLAWLLQLSVEGYGLVSLRIWLVDRTASVQTKAYAKRNAIGAISLSYVGNALAHLAVQMKWTASPWWAIAVVLVTGLPAVMLGLSVDMIVRLKRDREQSTEEQSTAAQRPAVRPAQSTATRSPQLERPVQSGQPVAQSSGEKRTVVPFAGRTAGKQSGSRGRDYEAIYRQARTDYAGKSSPSKRELMARYEISNAQKAGELAKRLREESAVQSTAQSATPDDDTERAVEA